jgi:hypothetical protein
VGIPSAAKAAIFCWAFAARLKPSPFKDWSAEGELFQKTGRLKGSSFKTDRLKAEPFQNSSAEGELFQKTDRLKGSSFKNWSAQVEPFQNWADLRHSLYAHEANIASVGSLAKKTLQRKKEEQQTCVRCSSARTLPQVLCQSLN